MRDFTCFLESDHAQVPRPSPGTSCIPPRFSLLLLWPSYVVQPPGCVRRKVWPYTASSTSAQVHCRASHPALGRRHRVAVQYRCGVCVLQSQAAREATRPQPGNIQAVRAAAHSPRPLADRKLAEYATHMRIGITTQSTGRNPATRVRAGYLGR